MPDPVRTAVPIALALILAISPTAAGAARRADPSAAILTELNRARADPPAYARQLRAYRARFTGLIVREPSEPINRITKEGVAAVDEAIAALRRQRPLAPLRASPALALAAADHVRDQGGAGARGHTGRDGSTPLGRILRRGVRPFKIGETIAYGPATAAAVVRELLVDDGVADRGHRLALLDPAFTRAGAACGPHRSYGTMCVIDFASAGEVPPHAEIVDD